MNHFLRIVVVFSYLLTLVIGPFSYAQESQNLPPLKSSSMQDFRVDGARRSFGNASPDFQRNDAITLSPIPSSGPGTASSLYYTVHLLGEVARPGTYKILPSDRLTDVLKYAGGILPTGSQRLIQFKRQNEVNRTLDLFSYSYFAKLEENPYLIENDVIVVPLKRGTIEIEGPVKRPGSYEIVKPISLQQALRLVGGFTVGRDVAESIRVLRYTKEGQQDIISVENSENAFRHFMVRTGDVVIVSHILNKNKKFDYSMNRIPGDNIFFPTTDDNVYVIGTVNQPGSYAYMPTYSIRQYINMAGPTKDAKIGSPKLILANGKKTRLSRNESLNPGDTIYIPEKRWRPETIISLVASVLGVTVTVIALNDRF